MITLVIVLFIIVAVLLILIILLQSSKATGMGIFGGGNSTDSVLGSGGMDVMTKITAVLGAVFLLATFGISYYYSKARSDSEIELNRMQKQQQTQSQEQQSQEQSQTPVGLPGFTTNK